MRKDDEMKGKVIYTDKGHERTIREVFPSTYMPGAEKLIISDQVKNGFVNLAPRLLHCYAMR